MAASGWQSCISHYIDKKYKERDRHFMCGRTEAVNTGDYVVTADRMGLGR